MAKGKSTWKYNKLLTARRNYFLTGGPASTIPTGTINYDLPKAPDSSLVDVSKIPQSNTGGTGGTGGMGLNAIGSIGIQAASNISNLIGNIQSNDIVEKADSIRNQARAAQAASVNSSDDSWDNLLTDWSNNAGISNVTAKQLGARNGAQGFADAFTAGSKGFAAGIGGGPIAGAAAAVGSTLTSIFGTLARNRKAKEEATKTNSVINYVNDFNDRSLMNRRDNLANAQVNDILSNYAAFGGPLLYSRGGSIHIKPENKGKFTETKRRTGKTTEELTHSSNPLTRKRAIFAQNAKKWHHAFGGELNTQGGDFTNGLLYIDNGSSHEDNPYEGVQLGVDPEGTPNLVEEGETVFNNYVFSKRLKVPKAIRDKYKMRGTKEMTFAEMSKELAKESEERPNDPISRRGLEALMSDLAFTQEKLKAKKGAGNQYANGGKVNKFDGLSTYSNYIQLPQDTDFYTPEYLEFWDYMEDPNNIAEATKWLDLINSGKFGDIGGNIFTLSDIQRLSRDYKKGPVHEAYKEAAAQFISGKNKPVTINTTEPEKTSTATTSPTPKNRYYLPDETGKYSEVVSDNPYLDIMNRGRYAQLRRQVNDLGGEDFYYGLEEEDPEYKELPTDLRYAPAVGLGIAAITDAVGLTNKPDYSNADAVLEASRGAGTYQPVRFNPIGNYLTYRPFDRDFYINRMNAEAGAARRSLLNTSGGNRAAAMAGILAADNNYLNQIGSLARQAEEYNLAQRQQVEDFNRNTNTTNSQGFLQADIANQKALMDSREFALKGAMAAAEMRERARIISDQAKSANLSGFITALGDIGRENMGWNWRNFGLATDTFGNVGTGKHTELLGNTDKKAKSGKIKRKKGLTI